jgi:hypothetical protein
MESLKKCVPSFLQWILSIGSQKRQKKKERRKAWKNVIHKMG